MIKTVLIDDERNSLETLQLELSEYCPNVEVVKTFESPQVALSEIKSIQPQLVFLDIEMPEMSGFDFLNELSEINFHVIFVTAYDRFALRAFEFNATDYLMKPVRKQKLIEAVEKVESRLNHNLDRDQLLALIQNLYVQQQPPSALQKIALPIGDGFNMVKVEDISHLEAESNYTWVHLVAGDSQFVSKTLKEIEALLQLPHFYRCHKSYLVNLNHIEKYVRGQGGYLLTEQGKQIPVSRSQKAELISLLRGQG